MHKNHPDFVGTKRYDLEERTEEFARRVGEFVERLPKPMSNLEYGKLAAARSDKCGVLIFGS